MPRAGEGGPAVELDRTPGLRGPVWTLVPWAVVLTATLVRFVRLAYKPLWFDEAICFWTSRGSVHEVVEANMSVRATPPLFSLLTNFALRFGDSEFVLRAIPALLGAAAVPATYLLARSFVDRAPSLVAASLVALSPSQVDYSQQLREYSAMFLVAVLMCLALARWQARPTPVRCAILSLTWTLGIATHYGLALLAAGLGLALLVHLRRSEDRKRLVVGASIALLPIVLGAAYAFLELGLAHNLAGGGPGVDSYLQHSYWDGQSLLDLGELAVGNTLAVFDFAFPGAGALVLALAVAGALWLGGSGGTALGVWLVLPFACTFLAACLGSYPYGGTRHAMHLLPMVYVAVGAGLDVLARGSGEPIARAAGAVLLVVGSHGVAKHLHARGVEDMRSVVETFERERAPSDGVFVDPNAIPSFAYYHREDGPTWEDFLLFDEDVRASEEPLHGAVDRAVEEAIAGDRRLWLVFATRSVSDRREAVLERVARERDVTTIDRANGVVLMRADPRPGR